MRLLAILALTTITLNAQSVLTTTFANNNQGAVGGTIYFDLSCTSDCVITGFDMNMFGTGGAAGTVSVYTTPGTSVGQELNAAAWTLHDTITLVTNPAGTPSGGIWDNGVPLVVLAGSAVGVAIVNDPALQHTYTTGGTGFPLVYEECPLRLQTGQATNGPFSTAGIGGVFSPRVPNLNIHFLHGANCATVAAQGSGCTANNPLSLAADQRPVQGSAPIQLTATAMGMGSADVFFVGVVGLTRPGLPLSVIGMPGDCFLHASPDFLSLELVTGPTMTYTHLLLPPVSSPLSGTEFNVQVLTHDAALNFANSRASNGLKYVIGDA